MREDPEKNGNEIDVENVLAQVSWQLRLSLGNIHSALERLAPPEARDGDKKMDLYAAILSQSYYRILRLTNNLSDAANMTGAGLVRAGNTDVAQLCRETAERAEVPAEMLGLDLAFECPRDHLVIAADGQRLEQLLLNLLSNAFKYTPRGGSVKVRLEVSEDRKWVLLRVADTGCGMTEQERDNVFERYRFNPVPDGKMHGLGLGLSICRRIAQEHGGSMVLVSAEGKGTTVTVSLPNRRGKEAAVQSPDMLGGFDRTMVELADALPKEAFTHQYLD